MNCVKSVYDVFLDTIRVSAIFYQGYGSGNAEEGVLQLFDRIMEQLDECELQSVNEIGAAQLKNMIEIADEYGEILWKLQGN